MKAATVQGHAARLRRICSGASYASMVPDHLPHEPVRVGDLPDFVFIRIGAEAQAGTLAGALRAWMREGRPT